MHDDLRSGRLIAAALPAAGLLAALGAAPPAAAQSFDCARAGTEVERTICAEPRLARLDLVLADAYAQARARAGDGAERLAADQRVWLLRRDRCADADCIARAYRERIASLRAAAEAPLGPAELTQQDDRVRLVQTGPNIEIEAVYPRFAEDTAGAEAASRAVAEWVAEQVEAFRGEYLRFLAESGGVHLGPPWALDIGFEARDAAPRLWTVDLTTYRYTGGAHGGQERTALVLERASGRRVPPEGLFRPGSAWLERLAEHCREALRGREAFAGGDEDWLARGTAPEAENYQVLLPIAEGLEVVFGQYQIGPYVIGISEVRVPYAELADLLDPDLFANRTSTP